MGIGIEVDFERYIQRLADANSPEIVNARIVQNLYPDVRLFEDVEGGYRYCSPSVNLYADGAFTMTGPDNTVWVLPYVHEAGIFIHTVPSMICIGRNVDKGFGVWPEEGWESVTEQFPKEIKDIIKDYLACKPPILW